jgi:hypothetical protein
MALHSYLGDVVCDHYETAKTLGKFRWLFLEPCYRLTLWPVDIGVSYC